MQHQVHIVSSPQQRCCLSAMGKPCKMSSCQEHKQEHSACICCATAQYNSTVLMCVFTFEQKAQKPSGSVTCCGVQVLHAGCDSDAC